MIESKPRIAVGMGVVGMWGVGMLVAGLLTASPAAAQEPAGLTYIVGVGYEKGGPGPALVEEMVEAGYDDRIPCSAGCGLNDPYPYYHDEGLNITGMVGLRYRFAAPFSLELLASNAQRGHGQGYSARTQTHLVLGYASYLVAATAGVHMGPVRLEAGPVLSATSWQVTRNSARRRDTRTTALGGTAAVSGSVRLSDMLLSLKVGVRKLQPADMRSGLLFPFEPAFESYFVAITVIPTGD